MYDKSHVVEVPNAITLNQSLKKSSQGPTIVAYSCGQCTKIPVKGKDIPFDSSQFHQAENASLDCWGICSSWTLCVREKKVFLRISQRFLWLDFQTKRIREMERWLRSVDWCSEIFALIVFNKDWISILHSACITIDYHGGCCKRQAWAGVENIQRKRLKCRERAVLSQGQPPTIPQTPIHSMHLDFGWPLHNIDGKKSKESCHHWERQYFTAFTEFAIFYLGFCWLVALTKEFKTGKSGKDSAEPGSNVKYK